ncbi:hypothetical protein EAF04_008765 [Stromatinia cepivora]|nr:hypothetical protein EAF04_008765 [Stromatinia cepivora]
MVTASQLVPTFIGYIATTQDALLLFEACLGGSLPHFTRRPYDRERAGLIKSGNVFIYEGHSSGIKRWTDGVPWSPSQLLGNFLIDRELDAPFAPGEKRKAIKRKQEPYGSPGNNGHCALSAAPNFNQPESNPVTEELQRSLVGSLVSSYRFKEEGLVKKTVRITIGEGIRYHIIP